MLPGGEGDIQQLVVPEDAIQARIRELGQAISEDYAGKNPLMVGVLKGVVFFLVDLLHSISIPVEIDFMAVSSYTAETRSRGMVRLVKDLEIPIENRHVLFVEDVVDTGLTLNYLLNNLRMRHPASLEVCALLNKPAHRLIDLPIRYKGFDISEHFVVGYGLDYRERYRNLPYVAVLKPEAMRK